MFVPVIWDPCAFYDYRYLWEYVKNLYHCYENGWAIIAEPQYACYRERRPLSNVYEEAFCSVHQYHMLTAEQEQQVSRYFIPDKILEKLKRKMGSELAAKIFLLQNRYMPLEEELHRIFRRIERNSGERVEGILTWGAHFKSLEYVARHRHIPVITNEFCIRFPEYYPLSYFCRKDIYTEREIKKAYRKFQRERAQLPYRLLSRRELLALFLEKDRIELLQRESGHKPEFEIGIAGCHPLIATFFAKSMYTDLELIRDVRNEYSEEDILFRRHPGDEPYQAKYTLKNQDESVYASDFILKCERITAQGSNTLVEAMLWGRRVYSHDTSPFTFLCERELHRKEAAPVSEEALNFIFLVYLVPFNKVWTSDYIRWRLKEKQSGMIYKRNVEYYFAERGIPVEVLKMPENTRLDSMLRYRKGERDRNEP